MQKLWNRYINLGVTDNLSTFEKTKTRMVNFSTLFVMFAGIAFYIQTLNVGSKILSISLLSGPIFFMLVPVFQLYGAHKIASNILFLGLCAEIGIYSLIDNPSSFTLNYFFGIAMLSFIVYNKAINQILGLVLCVILYFGLGYIQPFIQNQLPYNPYIYIMDVITLFLGILLCLNYFQRINKAQFEIILNQKIEEEKININKNKLISILSHDIRNPLNNLNQILKLHDNKSLNVDELNFILSKVRTEFIHQSESIENLLKWSQNQLTEIVPNFEKIDIKNTVEQLIQELNYNLQNKDIRVVNQVKELTYAKADHMHLYIVLRNVINNAIKFSPKFGEIIIKAEKNQDEIFIDIIDNGIGFENLPTKDFSNYNITESQIGTQMEKGNGLGLIICKELIEKNYGQLLIKNNSELGSTVRITLKI